MLLYEKMLQETETEETIGFVVTFSSMVAFKLGGCPSLATLMTYPLSFTAIRQFCCELTQNQHSIAICGHSYTSTCSMKANNLTILVIKIIMASLLQIVSH